MRLRYQHIPIMSFTEISIVVVNQHMRLLPVAVTKNGDTQIPILRVDYASNRIKTDVPEDLTLRHFISAAVLL